MEVMEGLTLDKQFAIEFAIQLALFLSSFLIMKLLVFKPMLELIHIREHKTHGLKEEAEEAQQKVAKLKTDYETFIKAEHRKTALQMDEEKKKVAQEESKIVQAARDEAAHKLDGLRKQINVDAEKVRGELSPLVSDFASRIASKLVGKPVKISGDNVGLKKNLSDRPEVQG
jgi:F-type H+-transporting ATPase subunit b